MQQTALVTGAYGFIGRHVTRLMASDGWRVIGMGHGSWIRNEWQTWGIAEWHSADITLDTLITYAGEPQIIVHCAGSGSVNFSMTHPYQDFQRTVATTLAVLEFGRLYAPKTQVAFPSSAAVYGNVKKLPIAETNPLSPISPYGVHKHLAENLCESYAKHFGISVAVVRLFSVYGVGLRKQLLWDASQKISRSENQFFGTGQEIRDWLHIDDAAHLLYTAARHASPSCPIVNGGTGKGASIREILSEIFHNFGRSDQPHFLGTPRQGDPDHYVADISLAHKWGWSAGIDWRKGIHDYVSWFKNQ